MVTAHHQSTGVGVVCLFLNIDHSLLVLLRSRVGSHHPGYHPADLSLCFWGLSFQFGFQPISTGFSYKGDQGSVL